MFTFDARNVGPEISFPSGLRFQLVETADESLTARLSSDATTTETMHSLRGAFLETVYIYGTAYEASCLALDEVSRKQGSQIAKSPRVFSLGLGLGYVELLSSALSILHNRELRGASFEAVPELNSSFTHWLGLEGAAHVPPSVYDNILTRTAHETKTDRLLIKERLKNAIQSNSWMIQGPLTMELVVTPSASQFGAALFEPFNCIAFDAFSSKSTPDLWTREFLDSFLAKVCDTTCVLSTYACTGHLKRALQAAGFELKIREGYASKRDSTLATRLE